jgi:hypothetical protein
MDPSTQPVTEAPASARVGSRDGAGAGDNDQPFAFGRRPSSAWTYPFTARQYTHLLVLRGRIQDGDYADDWCRR